jgi:hypothetical protein
MTPMWKIKKWFEMENDLGWAMPIRLNKLWK